MLYLQPPIQPNPVISIIQKIQEPPAPPKQLYTFKQDDVLERVATAQNTTVQRLFDKNPSISNPDVINVGETIEIPSADESLATRPLPEHATIQQDDKLGNGNVGGSPSSAKSSFSSSGNLYTPYNCTFFAKSRRPDIPNTWGDAVSWYYNAQKDGWATGSEPRVGAIAWARNYGHVAIVVGISGNQVTVDEQNYAGPGVIGTRVAPTSEFAYIY